MTRTRMRAPRAPRWGADAALALALTLLAGCTAAPPVPTPSPTLPSSYEEYNASYADWAPRYADCMREAGGNPRIVPGGIEGATIPGRPLDQGLDATCLKQVGPPPEPPALTDQYLAGYYELLVEEAECLRRHGYVVSDPPSRQEWVETYGAESWAPLAELLERGDDVPNAMKLCPQPEPLAAERRGKEIG